MKRQWELFKQRYTKQVGKQSSIASLTATPVRSQLLLGNTLLEAGFDFNARYDLFFDRDSLSIGLKVSTGGYKVTRSKDGLQRFMSISAFCKYYELQGRYIVKEFQREDGMWILPLMQMDV